MSGYTPICQVLIRQVQNGQVKLANSPNLPSDKPPSTISPRTLIRQDPKSPSDNPPSTDLPTGKLAKNEKSPSE